MGDGSSHWQNNLRSFLNGMHDTYPVPYSHSSDDKTRGNPRVLFILGTMLKKCELDTATDMTIELYSNVFPDLKWLVLLQL